MKYTIINIEHFKGEPVVIQGVKEKQLKKFRKEHKIYAGSNGSYVTEGLPAYTNVTIKNEEGRCSTIDAIDELKKVTNNRRFTAKFISELNNNLAGKTFNVEKNQDLKKCLYNFFKENI